MDVHGFKDTIAWYDSNAEEYAKNLYTVVPLESIEEFLKHLPEHPSVLDAGCGPGRESMIFHQKGAKVTGVDLSEGLLKVAREKNPEIEFVKANFLQLPFNDNTFDGVWSHASLVHLETIDDVQKALAEFFRVLKRDGIVYIAVKAQTGNEKTAVVSDTLSKHERFFRYYTSEELTGLLLATGFEMVSTGIKEDMHGRSDVQWLEFIARRRV
jgi:ubiquinone/menaquinone biosynthesis C-methylase UbiE